VDCALTDITATIAELSGTKDILDVEGDIKRRFVLQKDYNEYFFVLLDQFEKKFPSDIKICNIVRALLILIQNNIFYSITKFMKLIKFYKLNWKDDVRILANSNAFKAYLLRVTLSNLDKRQSESPELLSVEDQKLVDAIKAFKKQNESREGKKIMGHSSQPGS
jgi:hypothetical protein